MAHGSSSLAPLHRPGACVRACLSVCVFALSEPCKLDQLFYGLSSKIVVKPRSPCLLKPSVTQSSDLGLGLSLHSRNSDHSIILIQDNSYSIILTQDNSYIFHFSNTL